MPTPWHPAPSCYTSVGTILFNLVVNPVTGKVYVTNTELPNHVNFEGPGVFGGSTVQGHLSESRITVLDPAGPTVDVQHLNQHIDYSQLHTDPGADHAAIEAQKAHSLATPLQPVVSSDGRRSMWRPSVPPKSVCLMWRTSRTPTSKATSTRPRRAPITLPPAAAPAAWCWMRQTNRLYVLTRFDNQVEVIDLNTNTAVADPRAAQPGAAPRS